MLNDSIILVVIILVNASASLCSGIFEIKFFASFVSVQKIFNILLSIIPSYPSKSTNFISFNLIISSITLLNGVVLTNFLKPNCSFMSSTQLKFPE